jgi:hypothetical protein
MNLLNNTALRFVEKLSCRWNGLTSASMAGYTMGAQATLLIASPSPSGISISTQRSPCHDLQDSSVTPEAVRIGACMHAR